MGGGRPCHSTHRHASAIHDMLREGGIPRVLGEPETQPASLEGHRLPELTSPMFTMVMLRVSRLVSGPL